MERAVLYALGCPPRLVEEFEARARCARIGAVQAAIASGAFKASDVYSRLSKMFSFAGGDTPRRLRLPAPPDEAWTLLDRPVPLAAPGEDVIALNGQTFSMRTLLTLSEKLGDRRRRVKLLTRQELIGLITRSYGPELVSRAVAGLMKRCPDWSAKTGIVAWQAYFTAIAGGLILGAFAFAPREVMTLSSIGLSLFFLLAIALRLAAVASLAWPCGRKEKFPRLLSDAELPRYTVFVPLFKEAAILPHLAQALRKLDYPGIMAQTPEE